MKNLFRRFRSRAEDYQVRLNVETYGGRTVGLTLSSAADRVRLPLTPAEARSLAAALLQNARVVDPDGHVDLMAADAEQDGVILDTARLAAHQEGR
jgi:hypothetical protein